MINPVKIYLFKVNNRNTRKRCEICLKLTKTEMHAVFELENKEPIQGNKNQKNSVFGHF